MPPHTCLAGCGKRITWRFAICSDCEQTYGRSPRDWPEWLAFLWRDEQRMRRQYKRIIDHELLFCDWDETAVISEDGEIGND
jgi:hypothetical protein